MEEKNSISPDILETDLLQINKFGGVHNTLSRNKYLSLIKDEYIRNKLITAYKLHDEANIALSGYANHSDSTSRIFLPNSLGAVKDENIYNAEIKINSMLDILKDFSDIEFSTEVKNQFLNEAKNKNIDIKRILTYNELLKEIDRYKEEFNKIFYIEDRKHHPAKAGAKLSIIISIIHYYLDLVLISF